MVKALEGDNDTELDVIASIIVGKVGEGTPVGSVFGDGLRVHSFGETFSAFGVGLLWVVEGAPKGSRLAELVKQTEAVSAVIR